MEFKGTPGPWEFKVEDAKGLESEHYFFIQPNVAVIERKIAGRNEHDIPNARLIAAAPELLMRVKPSQKHSV